MQDNLAASGRKLVTIIDPHIKRDSSYYIYKEGQEKGLYVMNKDKQEFDGYGNTCKMCSALSETKCIESRVEQRRACWLLHGGQATVDQRKNLAQCLQISVS